MNYPGLRYGSFVKKGCGWSALTPDNPQTPYQINRGTDIAPEMVTYIYDIRSRADGTIPSGGHLWLPFSKDREDVKLFCDIIFPETSE